MSLPIGVYQSIKEEKKEMEFLLEKTYDDLDLRYVEFQKLSLQYPLLDVFDVPAESPAVLTDIEQVQQKMLYSIVISMLERAYITFQFRDLPSRQHQWVGWDEYASNFTCRAAFRKVWEEVGIGFDSRFQVYMNAKIELQALKSVPAATPLESPRKAQAGVVDAIPSREREP